MEVEKFSTSAKHALSGAVAEARRLNHHYLGTGHLLIALAKEDEAVSGLALAKLGVTPEQITKAVEEIYTQIYGTFEKKQ